MQTDDLILSLSAGITPVSRAAVERRILMGIAGGGIVTLAAIATLLGFRPDLGSALHGFSFWMKGSYTLALGIGAIAATTHLSRPDAPRAHWLWLLVIPIGLLAALAASELARTPISGWTALWQGESWQKCALLVTGLSVPIFLGLIWAFRQLAPANLRRAGAAAGLASGACAATLYGLHCPEASATFVLIWYTLGMSLATLGGAIAGPRLMRW